MKEQKENNKAPVSNVEKATVVEIRENTFKTVIKQIYKWAYKLRSVLLAIPVAVTASILAVRNMSKLPVKVGFEMQPSGEFAYLVSRNVAVLIDASQSAGHLPLDLETIDADMVAMPGEMIGRTMRWKE